MRVTVASCKVNNVALCKHNCAVAQRESGHVVVGVIEYWPIILQSYYINWLDRCRCIGVIIFLSLIHI